MSLIKIFAKMTTPPPLVWLRVVGRAPKIFSYDLAQEGVLGLGGQKDDPPRGGGTQAGTQKCPRRAPPPRSVKKKQLVPIPNDRNLALFFKLGDRFPQAESFPPRY